MLTSTLANLVGGGPCKGGCFPISSYPGPVLLPLKSNEGRAMGRGGAEGYNGSKVGL